MNKLSIKWIALALTAAMTLPALAACDSGKPEQTTAGTDAVTTPEATTAESPAPTAPTAPKTEEPAPDINVASLYSAKVALDNYISAFARRTSTLLQWTKSPYSRSQFFWTNAEVFEVIVDYAGALDDSKYDQYVEQAYKGFVASHGQYSNWRSNEYNDDLMWITIATAKAYLYTGNEEYKKCATTVFNYTFARAWNDRFGGGLTWKEGNTSKNACVNFPATIAACLLYKIHGDDATIDMVDYPAGETAAKKVTYLEAAKAIYGWSREALRVNDPNNKDYGRVYDTLDRKSDGSFGITNAWDGTYNQGTFIGSASLLYELTDDASYLDDAKATFHYTALVKYGERTVVSDEGNGNDLPGFKGIMMRWICYFIKNHYDEIKDDMAKEMAWVTRNVNTAWKNRNSKNIIWTAWGTKTNDQMNNITVPGDKDANCYSCWGCSAALALLINYPYDLLPVK